jgi:hypothetical protein
MIWWSAQMQQDSAWTIAKACFVVLWLKNMIVMAVEQSGCTFPVGICQLYHFAPMFEGWGLWIALCLLLAVGFFYLAERKMMAVTLMGTLLSVIIISRHESGGLWLRATAFSLVWAGQYGAYAAKWLRPTTDLAKWRMQLPVQGIAALYTLSGISKLKAVGLSWSEESAANLALPVLKGARFEFYTNGNADALERGFAMAEWLMEHPVLTEAALWVALLLELCCMAAAFNERLRLWYGLALVAMHIGIAVVMDIVIAGQVYPMVIFFINPAHLLREGGRLCSDRSGGWSQQA